MSDEAKTDEPAKPEYGEFHEVTVAGNPWKLARVGYGLRLDAADEIRKQRRIEFRNVLDSVADLDGPQKDSAVMTAFENLLRNVSVSMYETQAWLGSPDGEFYQIFKSLKLADPNVTRDTAAVFYDGLTPVQLADCQKFLIVKLMGE